MHSRVKRSKVKRVKSSRVKRSKVKRPKVKRSKVKRVKRSKVKRSKIKRSQYYVKNRRKTYRRRSNMSGGSDVSELLPDEILQRIILDSGTYQEFIAKAGVNKLWNSVVNFIIKTPALLSKLLSNYSDQELIKMSRNSKIVDRLSNKEVLGIEHDELVKEINKRHLFNQIEFSQMKIDNTNRFSAIMEYLHNWPGHRYEDRDLKNEDGHIYLFPEPYGAFETWIYNMGPLKPDEGFSSIDEEDTEGIDDLPRR